MTRKKFSRPKTDAGRPVWTYSAPRDAIILERYMYRVIVNDDCVYNYPGLEQVFDWSTFRRDKALAYLIDNNVITIDRLQQILLKLLQITFEGDCSPPLDLPMGWKIENPD